MMEFCSPENFKIVLVRDASSWEVHSLGELLPQGFGPGMLRRRRAPPSGAAEN